MNAKKISVIASAVIAASAAGNALAQQVNPVNNAQTDFVNGVVAASVLSSPPAPSAKAMVIDAPGNAYAKTVGAACINAPSRSYGEHLCAGTVLLFAKKYEAAEGITQDAQPLVAAGTQIHSDWEKARKVTYKCAMIKQGALVCNPVVLGSDLAAENAHYSINGEVPTTTPEDRLKADGSVGRALQAIELDGTMDVVAPEEKPVKVVRPVAKTAVTPVASVRPR